MTSRRIAKLSSAIREQVSTSILFDLKDPRVHNVTVTGVEVSSDAQRAKVHVSVLGSEKDEALCLHGLNSARGFLQSKVAARIRARHTPILSFHLDRGIKRSAEVSRIIRDETDLHGAADGEETPDQSDDLKSPHQALDPAEAAQNSP